MEKICTECNLELPATLEFFAIRDNGIFRRQCRKCINKKYNERQAEKLKDKREARVKALDEERALFESGYKICSTCNQQQLVRAFNTNKKSRFNLESSCKNCKAHAKSKRLKKNEPMRRCRVCGMEAWNPEKLELFAKAGGKNKFGRYNLCKSCHSKSDNSKKHNNSLEKRCKKFGITVKQYEQMVSSQNNSCAICKKHKDEFVGRGKTFHIDHCHESGRVRGLLCSNCNTGLGQFKDDIISLESAILYLKE